MALVDTSQPGKPEEWKEKITPWDDRFAIGMQLFLLLVGMVGAVTISLISLISAGLLLGFHQSFSPKQANGFRHLTYHLALAMSLGPLLIDAMNLGFTILELGILPGQALQPHNWAFLGSAVAYPILFMALLADQPHPFRFDWWMGLVLGAFIPLLIIVDIGFLNQFLGTVPWLYLTYPFWLALVPVGSWLFLRKLIQPKYQPLPVARYKLLIYAVVAFVVILLKVWFWYVDPFVKKLPMFTYEYQTWQWKDGFLPDELFLLKAKISESEFRTYVNDLGLKPATPELPVLWHGGFGEGPDGWDCDGKMEGSFFEVADPEMPLESNTIAKYQNGYLYLNYNRM